MLEEEIFIAADDSKRFDMTLQTKRYFFTKNIFFSSMQLALLFLYTN